MTRTDVVRHRLASQFLTMAGPRSASEAVRALGAVQAQDYAGAKWALAMRSGDPTDAAIEQEISDGKILRTHVLRPTWHFVAPQDIRWMLALTKPRIESVMASYNRKLELTPAVFRRSHGAIAKALEGGKHLTRAELSAALAKARVGPVSGQRLAHIMMQAELDAVVCSGARQGKQFTYALIDERVPAVPTIARDESLARLARLYFASRSPASLHDFSWWSGLAVRDARRAIGALESELVEISIDSKRMWSVEQRPPLPKRIRTAHLLPNYDEYFIGFKDRSSIGARVRGTELVTGGSALINHILVIDGQIVGGWKRLLSGHTTIVAVQLLVELAPVEQKLVEGEARRMETYLESPVRIEFTRPK